MKSVRLHGTGDLQIHDESVPAVADGGKLIRVKAVGICGSDLHWFSRGGIGDAQLDYPLVLGHEFAGETEDRQCVALGPAIPVGTVNFVSMVISIYVRIWPLQSAIYKMAWHENRLFPKKRV